MQNILSREAMKESDKYTINNIVSEEELVRRAGETLFKNYDYPGKTSILIGKGNNGADGVYLSLLLNGEGKEVELIYFDEPKSAVLIKLLDEARQRKIKICKYDEKIVFDVNTIVDGIYGTGFTGELSGDVKDAITKVNQSMAYKIAIDINSGLDSNTGLTSLAFISDLTISIGYYKPGHFLNMAKDYIKKIKNEEIGIELVGKPLKLFEESDLNKVFIKRMNYSHKGSYGYVGIMGGSINYSGAVKLSSLALVSLVSGAGVARIIAPSELKESILPLILEQTFYPIASKNGYMIYDGNSLFQAISKLKSVAFGMGLGESPDNEKILLYLLKNYQGYLLIDADGLNTLAKMNLDLLNESKAKIILTPHLMEFSRISKISIDKINENPIKAVLDFTNKYNVTLLLKGTSTIIAKKDELIISNTGTVSLSKGGSGDILSGIIAGIMGFCEDPLIGAASGAYLLGKAGEISLDEYGSYSSLARNTIESLQKLIKKY